MTIIGGLCRPGSKPRDLSLFADVLGTTDEDPSGDLGEAMVPLFGAETRKSYGGLYLAGIYRKITVISTNLAVAWCGSSWCAERVIRRLRTDAVSDPERVHDLIASEIGSASEDEAASGFIYAWRHKGYHGIDSTFHDRVLVERDRFGNSSEYVVGGLGVDSFYAVADNLEVTVQAPA